MSELYLKSPSIITCIEAGRKALSLGLAKQLDVHFADAVCEAVHHATVLTMGHEDEQLIGEAAENTETLCSLLSTCLDDLEASLPKGGEVDQASLTPDQIMLLFQTIQMLWSLFKRK